MKKLVSMLIASLALSLTSLSQSITMEKVMVPSSARAGDKAVTLISVKFICEQGIKPLYSLDIYRVYISTAAANYFHNIILWNMESNESVALAKYEAPYLTFYIHAILDENIPTRTFTVFADVGLDAESMKFGIYIDPGSISASSIIYGRGIPILGEVKVEPFTLYARQTVVLKINNNNWNLDQNYPNPFNPTTTIKFSVPTREKISLKVFDALGREVRTLVNEIRDTGEYQEIFDARDLSSGTYYYLLQAGTFRQTKKMTLLK